MIFEYHESSFTEMLCTKKVQCYSQGNIQRTNTHVCYVRCQNVATTYTQIILRYESSLRATVISTDIH